ncbi:MAG: hypothetical protein MZV63_32505 [Marinilabiliales bacterium]|nr:hypothetical protein [Marinilabiliales bacterium]
MPLVVIDRSVIPSRAASIRTSVVMPLLSKRLAAGKPHLRYAHGNGITGEGCYLVIGKDITVAEEFYPLREACSTCTAGYTCL